MAYSTLGNLPVIPAADLIDLQSNANKPCVGNTRVGAVPSVLGKRPGMRAFRDAGAGALSLVFATGGKSSDAWREADGSASRTPTNLGAFTDGADTDYAAGLLTTDGGNDAAGRTAQSLTLTAGTYLVSGTAAVEGASASDYTAPRIRVGTGAGGSQIASKVVGVTARHATAAESADPKEDFAFTIVVGTTGTVYFTLDVVDEAGALAAGSAYITLNALEALA